MGRKGLAVPQTTYCVEFVFPQYINDTEILYVCKSDKLLTKWTKKMEKMLADMEIPA